MHTASNARRTAIRTRQALLVGFLPLLVLAALGLGRPTFGRPMGLEPAETFLGFTLEVLVFAAVIGWGALGGLLVSRTTSVRAILVALTLFTIPSSVAVPVAPAIVLILQNLG